VTYFVLLPLTFCLDGSLKLPNRARSNCAGTSGSRRSDDFASCLRRRGPKGSVRSCYNGCLLLQWLSSDRASLLHLIVMLGESDVRYMNFLPHLSDHILHPSDRGPGAFHHALHDPSRRLDGADGPDAGDISS
jgi:hypothetical protein